MKLDGFRSCTCWAERRIRKPSHEKHQRIQQETVLPCTSYVLSAPFFAERILGLRLRFMSVRSDEGYTTAEVIGRIIHEPTHIG